MSLKVLLMEIGTKLLYKDLVREELTQFMMDKYLMLVIV